MFTFDIYDILLTVTHILSPAFLFLSHPLSLRSHHVSLYFDEEQDDYENPYYHEETTQAPPSTLTETLANQVKRGNLKSKTEKRGWRYSEKFTKYSPSKGI